MDIRRIHATDEAFSDWFAVYQDASATDDPSGPQWREREFRAAFEPSEHRDVLVWLAEDQSRPIGAAALILPLRDNVSLAAPEIYVRADARRRGVGTALLGVVERAASERDRTSLLAYVSSSTETPVTPGSGFAEHHGFTARITEIRRVARPPFPLETIAAAVRAAAPFAAEYEIVSWRDTAPDTYVKEYARLEGRLSTDAPMGDLEYEGEMWDEARIRTMEDRHKRAGRNIWTTAAIAPNGLMAGFTQVVIAHDSDHDALQDTTIVDPAHRGHRLGIVLKATNLEQVLADRPGVRQIWTWNAENNTNMIAINETMGYEIEGWDRAYQRDVRR